MAIQAPKGTKDVTPRESYKWQYIEKIARETCDNFGFSEIRTPSLSIPSCSFGEWAIPRI